HGSSRLAISLTLEASALIRWASSISLSFLGSLSSIFDMSKPLAEMISEVCSSNKVAKVFNTLFFSDAGILSKLFEAFLQLESNAFISTTKLVSIYFSLNNDQMIGMHNNHIVHLLSNFNF